MSVSSSASLSSLFSSSVSSSALISSLVFWLKNPSPPWHAYKEVQAHISIVACTSLGVAWSSTDTRALDHFQYVIRSKRHMVRNSSRRQRCGTVTSSVTSCPPMGQRIHVGWVEMYDMFLCCYLHACGNIFCKSFICRGKALKLRCSSYTLRDFPWPDLLTGISEWCTFRTAIAG